MAKQKDSGCFDCKQHIKVIRTIEIRAQKAEANEEKLERLLADSRADVERFKELLRLAREAMCNNALG